MKKNTNCEKNIPPRRKHRQSASREAMLECLSEVSKPISVLDMIERIVRNGKRYNKTTLYREIETLKQMGKVKEIFFRNDTALYELAGTHHHHLVCVSCGDIREVTLDESFSKEEKRLARKEKFTIVDHSLEFFGRCEGCR